jgi:hypothetical protein
LGSAHCDYDGTIFHSGRSNKEVIGSPEHESKDPLNDDVISMAFSAVDLLARRGKTF